MITIMLAEEKKEKLENTLLKRHSLGRYLISILFYPVVLALITIVSFPMIVKAFQVVGWNMVQSWRVWQSV